MNHQQKEDIRRMREEGQSYTKIAELLGISENTVKSYCRRNSLGGVALVASESVNGTYCHQCGAPITQTAGRKQKLYFSDKCRMAWWNAHPAAVNRKTIRHFNCKTCGRSFEGYGNRERKYCSTACYCKSKAVRP